MNALLTLSLSLSSFSLLIISHFANCISAVHIHIAIWISHMIIPFREYIISEAHFACTILQNHSKPEPGMIEATVSIYRRV